MKKIINMACRIFLLGLMIGPICFVHAQDITYGIIRIQDPNNPGRGITIHDRNLGATATGYGATDDINSYGYYYQWGNNYGFPSDPSESIITDNAPVDTSSYGPSEYSSDTFIIGNSDWSSERNDNLRGGEGDDKDSNNRGYPVRNAGERRGPCPENYHVPSIGELNALMQLWNTEYFSSSYNDDYTTSFIKRFYIPFAGCRTPTIQFDKWRILLRSSSPSSSAAKRLYYSSDGLTTASYSERSYAFPIRCFYDSDWLPVKITYEVNGGYRTNDGNTEDKIITYTKDNDNSDFSGDIALGTVKRDDNCGANGDKKCMFGGRYTLTGDELWTGNISEDITLYAKRLEFDDLNIPYSGVNFTIMDRNLGAENSGTDENAYGYYLTGGENDIICPEGYHIPSTGEWLGIKKLLDSDFNGNLVKNLLVLPFAGKFINNEVVETGNNGYYLARDGDEIKYAKITDSDIEIKNLEDGERVSARCLKDYNTGTIKFHPNGGNKINDIIAVNRWEEGENLQIPSRDNSIFSGWYTTINFQEGTKLEKNINYKNEDEINLYAKWECEEGYQGGNDSCDAIYFDITWIDGDGNDLRTDSVKWGEIPVYDGAIPTKSSTTDYRYTFNNNWLPTVTAAFEDTGYVAQFDAEYIKKSGGSSGGGGRSKNNNVSSGTNTCPAELGEKDLEGNSQDSSAMPQNDDKSQSGINNSVISNIHPTGGERGKSTKQLKNNMYMDSSAIASEGQNFSQEFINAYNFAYQYGITTKPSIKDAKMYSSLTRIQMAKMLSNYAINVLGRQPDLSKGTVKFSDVSNKLNKKYDNAINLVYQLGIMGQNIKSGRFRPYDEVTRAEFVTALSRLLYGIEDGEGNTKYYMPHITNLYNKGIINKTSPVIKEKRGYIMIMLMRTKNYTKNNE